MSRSSWSASRSLPSSSPRSRCASSRRTSARAPLGAEPPGSLSTVKLLEEFANKRLKGQAGAPDDFASALGSITAASVYFVGHRPAAADRRGALRQGAEGHRGAAQLELLGKTAKRRAQTLDLKLADGTSTLAAAGGFRYGGQLIGAIVVARPVRSINASTLVQGRRVVLPLLLAVLAGALVALLLSRRITRPVRELTEASERIALGDYDVHLTSKGPDELGQLALRFEQMARQLKEASEHERNFLMRISHELRTPLTAIQGHVQAIADGVIDGEEEQQASLEIVLAGGGPAAAPDRRPARPRAARDAPLLAQRRGGRPARRLRARGRRAARGGPRPPRQPACAGRRESRSCSATATASCRSSRISSRTPCTRRPPMARSPSRSRGGRGAGRRERHRPGHPGGRAGRRSCGRS